MHPISSKIESLHRRLIWRERALAACRALTVVVAVAVALGLVDYFARSSDRGLRWMISAAMLAAAGWAAYRWWWLPRRQRPDRLGVARRLESRFPQLRDRLASALEFLNQDETDATAGSAELRRAVVAEADLALAELPVDDVADRRPLQQAAVWAMLASAVVVLGLMLDARAVGTALMRLAVPWGSTEWPRENHLEFHDPPTRLAAGQAFEVELHDRDGNLPENARIEYRTTRDGRSAIDSEWMRRVGDIMVARRNDVRESFAFRAVGGDDNTMRWHEVEVVEPPQLKSVSVTVHPPAYTGLSAVTASGHLRVLAGSGIAVQGEAAEPLGTARILYGEKVIEAAVPTFPTGIDGKTFEVSAENFVADENAAYAIELADSSGVAGVAGKWNLTVEPDSSPTVNWRQPRSDLFVLPAAIVPIAIDAYDNLKIAEVKLEFTRSDRAENGTESIVLDRGPEHPSHRAGAAELNNRPDARQLVHSWQLADLNVPVGSQLVVEAIAADYRPGVGRTVSPRRITIISREELDARLADRQTQIVARLNDALATQRRIRDELGIVEIGLRETRQVSANDRDALQSSELAQRRLEHNLVDATDGLPAIRQALLDELQINGVEATELVARLDKLQATLRMLDDGPLSTAERELTAARKFSLANDVEATRQSLITTAQAQDKVAQSLERAISEFQQAADIGILVHDLAQLRQHQADHIESTRREIGLATLPLELRELSNGQRASLRRASAGEDALLRRFERIEQRLAKLAADFKEGNADLAGRVVDAVELARNRAISAEMRDAVEDLAANRVGQAIAREKDVVQAFDEMLNILRDRTRISEEEAIARLRAAQEKLAALRAESAKLRQELAATEHAPAGAAKDRQMEALRRQQARLRSEIAKLAREMKRIDAEEASRSTSQAADRLAGQRENMNRPAESHQVERAEQDLAEAAKQLAERRAQVENDWAQKFLERFQQALMTMVSDQKAVIAATAEIDAERGDDPLDAAQVEQVGSLDIKERQLADDAHVHAELLAGLRVFGVALEAASKKLTAAAEGLRQHETGPVVQRAERRALERFEQIVWALEQTRNQAQQQPPSGQPPGNSGGGQQPRPLVDLFEVKLLRMLQTDLNERTRALQEMAGKDAESTDAERDDLAKEAESLVAEQRRLAELAADVAARNNDEQDEGE